MKALKCKVVDTQGKEVGSVDLDPVVFGVEGQNDLVHSAVRWQRACKRSGTHATINKANYKGGSRKPWNQKGTGNARAGGADSPIWVGGAVAHGPTPRKYDFRLSLRSRRQALAAVLSDKLSSENLVVVDSLTVKQGKTSELVAIIAKLGLSDQKITLVLPETAESSTWSKVWQSSGNLQNVKTISVRGANPFDLLTSQTVVCTTEGLEGLTKRVRAEKKAE